MRTPDANVDMGLVLRVGVVCLLAWVWDKLLLDQLPCCVGATKD